MYLSLRSGLTCSDIETTTKAIRGRHVFKARCFLTSPRAEWRGTSLLAALRVTAGPSCAPRFFILVSRLFTEKWSFTSQYAVLVLLCDRRGIRWCIVYFFCVRGDTIFFLKKFRQVSYTVDFKRWICIHGVPCFIAKLQGDCRARHKAFYETTV